MTRIVKFEDIVAWQKVKLLSLNIYQSFKDIKDFSFRDQIQRATISVMNNIAEGFERNTNKEFKNFLYIAKGSCGEVRSMLYVSKELKYSSSERVDELQQDCLEISRLLSGFIKTL